MNSLLIALECRQRNCYCIVPNEFCVLEMTEIPIVIDLVSELGTSLETPSSVIM